MDDDIFKITKDKDRASDLLDMAKDRLELMKLIPRNKSYKIIEEYYEIIKELMTALMYLDGYKTLSHIKLIEYTGNNCKDLDETELKIVDSLRKIRNGITYYGRKVSDEFLISEENEIKLIIKILFKTVENKVKKS